MSRLNQYRIRSDISHPKVVRDLLESFQTKSGSKFG